MRAFAATLWAIALCRAALSPELLGSVQLIYGAQATQARTIIQRHIDQHPNDPAGYILRGIADEWYQLTANKDTQFGFSDGYVLGNSVAKGMNITMVGSVFRRNPTAVVVLDESSIKTPKDLEGKTLAFPSKDAFIDYRVPRHALKQAGITVVQVFGASKQGAAVQLQTGRADAASLNKMFADRFQAEGKGRFRVLYESEAWPNIPIQAHPRIAKASVEAVRKALLNMGKDADGRALLAKLKIPGFLPVTDADYGKTRRLYKEPL